MAKQSKIQVHVYQCSSHIMVWSFGLLSASSLYESKFPMIHLRTLVLFARLQRKHCHDWCMSMCTAHPMRLLYALSVCTVLVTLSLTPTLSDRCLSS